ncbi:MAG TPA: four helix bundle protein [Flavobacterium sp.]|nr:four helix bundle protein [Flavobacterium sp.]
MNHNFKNLKIWQLAIEISKEIYLLTNSFPKNEMYALANQINRAAVSIASNIAEGSNRSNTHFIHYLNIALGSSFELQTQLIISNKVGYLTEEHLITIETQIIELQKMISGFINKLNN